MDEQYSIKQVAKKLELSASTLRRLERRGVVVPGRTPGGHRRYTIEQVKEIKSYLRKQNSLYQQRQIPNVTLD